MKHRTVSQVVYAAEHQMGPLTIRQPLPSDQIPYFDPFVLLHHTPSRLMGGRHGVDAHPHRGFAPVTFIFKGGVRHRDSRGNDSTVTAGGTQWMHAGAGILHEEIPLSGELELIQLWVNSPAEHKMDVPSYHPLTQEQTPRYVSDDGLVTVNVVAGELLGIAGPVPTLTPVNAATIQAKTAGRLSIPVPARHNAFVYVLDGGLQFDDRTGASGLHQVVFNADGEGIEIEALENTRALLMTGEPIAESIVSHGPFVMNTEDEIRAAYRDYRNGSMGHLTRSLRQQEVAK